MIGDIVRHLQGYPFLIAQVRQRIFGTTIPDKQPMPYVLVELTGEATQRTSGNSLVKATVKITAFAQISADAERFAGYVSTRMKQVITATESGSVFIDAKQTNYLLSPVPYRTPDGALGFQVPLTFTVLQERQR